MVLFPTLTTMALHLSRTASLRQTLPVQRAVWVAHRHLSDLTSSTTAEVNPYSHSRVVSIPNSATNSKVIPPLAKSGNGVSVSSSHYTITRTPTRGLPVYEIAKAGGTLKLTRIRKLEGNRERLKKDLESYLEPKPSYVKINPVTGHVIVKVCLHWCHPRGSDACTKCN